MIIGDQPLGADSFDKWCSDIVAAVVSDIMSGAADPQSSGSTKPYNEAVNDVHRYLKEVVEKAPDTQIDGSVKEGVTRDLDKAIKDREGQKPWPGAFR